MSRCHKPAGRRGAVAVLTAVMIVMICALVAFAVDIGYLLLARTQVQSAADAAAMAAAWELFDGRVASPTPDDATVQQDARAAAAQYAQRNPVGTVPPALADSDVAIGRLDVTAGSSAPLTFDDPARFNAAKVRVRRAESINGEVALFFARVLGIHSGDVEAEATAAFIDNFSGFTIPPTGKGNLKLLPIAVDKTTWDALLAGGGTDAWAWNESTKQVSRGSDGIPEINIFPQGTGAPGNRGTVNIGRGNNGTSGLAEQIRDGLTEADLLAFDGKLEIPDGGSLDIPGDPGVSAGVKDDLAAICGQTRIIPIFDAVSGSGSNTQYRIVGFAGVRVIDVNLTGKLSDKHVTIQPADIQIYGGIPGSGTTTSYNLYSPVWLVR